MIIGMLALSDQSVLTEKVDVMLRVGLGRLGKVSHCHMPGRWFHLG